MAAQGAELPAKQRVWKAVRAAAVAIVSLFLLYVVGINVFLSTSLFDTVINGQDPEMLRIEFRRGWSIFPGRIHARDLSIRSSDSNVEWILRLDEVEFDVSFIGLARKKFDVSRARGRGISMRARQKLDAAPNSAEEVAYLPPVPGFPAFSVRPAGPPSPERWDDSQYALWTVELDDVIGEDVREVWVDSARFEGSARVEGRFYLKPIRAAEVGPAHIAVDRGRVTAGPALVIAPRVAGNVDVTIHRFDPREVPLDRLVRFISAKTDLRGSFADLSTLPLQLPVYASGTFDVRRFAVALNHGVISQGTRVELGTHLLTVSKANLVGQSAVDLTVDVARDGATDRLQSALTLRDISVLRSDAVQILHAQRILTTTDARALDLANDPFRDAHVTTDLPDVELADARLLAAFIPEATPITVMNGSARAQGRVEVSAADKTASGSGHLQGNDLDVRVSKLRTRGSFDVIGSFTGYHWPEKRIDDAKLTAVVADGALASDPALPQVKVGSLILDTRAANVDLTDPLNSIEASFEVPDASIADVALLRNYLPQQARASARFALEGQLTIADHLARGRLHAHSKELQIRVGEVDVRAQVDARAKVHDWNWERGDLAVDDALVDVTNVAFSRAGASLASVDRIAVRLESSAFSFATPFNRVDLTARVDGGKVKDESVVDGFMPDGASYGVASKNGTFAGGAHFTVRDRIVRGKATASAQHMGLRSTTFAIHGNGKVDADIERWDLDKKVVSLGPSRVAISEIQGTTQRGDQLTMGGIEVAGRARDLDLTQPSLRGVDARFVLDNVEIPDARTLAAMMPDGSAVRIESGEAYASGAVEISSSARTAKGTVSVDIRKGAIAVNQTQLSGNFGLRAKVSGFDPDASTFDISGSRLIMRDVTVAAYNTTAWRGDAALEKATVCFRTSDPPSPTASGVDAVVRLDADNARPLLGVLLADSLPKFLVGLATMPRLEAYARVRLAPHALVISDVSASGGDVAVRGAYAVHDEDRSGAFVVEKGPFSVGLGLHKDGTSPRFFNLDVWLAAQEKNVKARAPHVGHPALTGKAGKAGQIKQAVERAEP